MGWMQGDPYSVEELAARGIRHPRPLHEPDPRDHPPPPRAARVFCRACGHRVHTQSVSTLGTVSAANCGPYDEARGSYTPDRMCACATCAARRRGGQS